LVNGVYLPNHDEDTISLVCPLPSRDRPNVAFAYYVAGFTPPR
jgi:hypothetical protein